MDVGAGWFLSAEDSPPVSILFNAFAENPAQHFGPAAWRRADGPFCGQPILEARPTAEGDWQQTGEQEWKWVNPDGQEFDEAPPCWPRCIVVMDESLDSGLSELSGQVVSSEAELVDLVREVASKLPWREIPLLSSKNRLAEMRVLLPQAFQ